MKQKFIKFLKDNGVYDRFIEEMKKYGDYNSIDELIEINQIFFLRSAFLWINTDEGLNFWNDINNKWWRVINETEEL